MLGGHVSAFNLDSLADDEDSITKFTNLLLENEDITAFIDNLMQE
jgi:hypothetical protein